MQQRERHPPQAEGGEQRQDWLILWLNLPDLAALLLFALPVAAYVAWCSVDTRAAQLRFAMQIYLVFAAVTLASAAIVYVID